LIEHQYLFLAASFTAGDFDQDIDSDGPIPVSGPFDEEDAGAGPISNIFDAYIDPDHNNFGTEDGFVIKRIGDKDEARRAIRVLADLESSPGALHEHLARIYSAFWWERNGCTYLIAERANDNLNAFMENNPGEPWPGHMDGTWLLSQLRGLASALDALHTGVPGITFVHHDVKPTNILVFTDEESGISTFRITNWSHATTKLHDSSTAPVSHNSPTTGRSSYHAPEYYSDEPSAKHNIWSLGCIFLELLIWHAKGWHYLEDWRRSRENANDASFFVDGRGSQLIGIVDAELDWLHSNGFPGQIQIIRQMLSINKEARPSASQVESAVWEEED
jgi:serine/threonine protein kinase